MTPHWSRVLTKKIKEAPPKHKSNAWKGDGQGCITDQASKMQTWYLRTSQSCINSQGYVMVLSL